MIDLKARKKAAPILEPIARALAKIGVGPTLVTVAGLAITIAGSVLIANGLLWQGGFVAGFGVLLDALDGPLARLKGTASDRGAFIDTMSDRFGEIAVWVGLGVYLRDDPVALILCLVALAFSLLVPYIRAKAESWGAEGRGGWMGRAERMIVALWGIILAGFGLPVLVPMLWVFVVLTALTVVQRIRKTWQQLPG
ncbi:MAG: CDP-alcohol phosphatidyltransferase family protein [Actinomycetota bacterium]|nr:CDP-alcohol phosphatidyltransferase family protein [Actinomycetota bacterium]